VVATTLNGGTTTSTLDDAGPLLHGGRLALLPPGPYSLADIYAAVARQGVTTLWLASAFFQLAVEEGLAPLGGLRLLEAGGDVVSRPHFRNVLVAQLLYAGDNVGGESWDHREWAAQRSIRKSLFFLACEACCEAPI